MLTFARLTAAVIATVGTGIILLKLMEILGIGSFISALVLNFLLPMWILVVFILSGPDLTRPWLDFYFKSRRWERDGKFYLPLGILRFQTMLFSSNFYKDTLYSLRPPGYRVRNDGSFFQVAERNTRNAEAAHGACFLVVLGFAAYAGIIGSISGVVWLIATGIVWQLYPVLLQRYHRPRWRRLLNRLSGTIQRSDPSA
jgi:hypothetical protein